MCRIPSIITLFLLICYSSVFAQVIEPPTITCATSKETDNDVVIEWTLPTIDPCGPFIGYVIFGATDSLGPYTVIDTVFNPNSTSFVHLGANNVPQDWYYFMVTTQDCPGVPFDSSAIVGEVVLFTPQINYVTVVPGGVEIYWYPISSLNADGYIVKYLFSDGTNQEVLGGTVFGRNSTFYFDTNKDPTTSSILYTLESFLSCGNKKATSLFDIVGHRTIYLEATDVDPCESNISLSWNEYINWPNGVERYQLEIQIDDNPATIEETFSTYDPPFEYDLSGVIGDTICLRMQAVRGDGIISSSNRLCVPVDFIRSTSFNYLRNATVTGPDEVTLEWYIDSTADISSYNIKRGVEENSLFSIDSLPVTNPTFFNTYQDNSAATDETSYYYQVESIDDCNKPLESNIGRTIHLSGTADAGTNTLTWNPFELENAVVLDYTLSRVDSDNNNITPLATLPQTELEYEDFVATEISDDGTFCYVIDASFELDLPGFPMETLTSRSNILCLDVPPVIYVPNAFVPDGTNNNFKPVLLNPNVRQYDFKIFDRWGKIIFETDQVNVGWDGSRKGEVLPTGGYVYYVKVVSRAGIEEQQEGVVVLVR